MKADMDLSGATDDTTAKAGTVSVDTIEIWVRKNLPLISGPLSDALAIRLFIV